MSVEQTNVVDAIGIERDSDRAVMTITDHLPFGARDEERLLLLQDKLNAYLAFIESGELLEAYPDACGRKVTVEIVFKHEPIGPALAFLERAQKVMASAGIPLIWRSFSPEPNENEPEDRRA